MQMENYVFFKTNDQETIELVMVLVRQGRASMVDEKGGKQVSAPSLLPRRGQTAC